MSCPPTLLKLVFPSLGGGVMSNRYMTDNALAPVLIAAGVFEEQIMSRGTVEAVRRYSLQNFRHAGASLWIEQRVSPKRIQYWMGHSSIQVTFDVYGHLFEQAEQDAAIAREVENGLTRFFEATWMQHAA